MQCSAALCLTHSTYLCITRISDQDEQCTKSVQTQIACNPKRLITNPHTRKFQLHLSQVRSTAFIRAYITFALFSLPQAAKTLPHFNPSILHFSNSSYLHQSLPTFPSFRPILFKLRSDPVDLSLKLFSLGSVHPTKGFFELGAYCFICSLHSRTAIRWLANCHGYGSLLSRQSH